VSIFSYENLKKILFMFEPERAHSVAGCGLTIMSKIGFIRNMVANRYLVDDAMLRCEYFGKSLPNPIGLGAGFDKNGSYIDSIGAIGFGYTEIGTVTPRPQDGNAKPRLFRLVEDNSLQNAMGFNNHGMHKMIEKLKHSKNSKIAIGVNIGKNKLTSEENAINDYKVLIENLESYSDYIVINISSPNTPGLRDLQNEEFIRTLFTMAKKLTNKPIFLKIAPDMSSSDAIALCKVAIEYGANGIIATNTTIDYSLTPNAKDFGGISGALLTKKSRELFKAIGKEFYDKTMLISVGGIDSANEAYERIKDGASLIQIYSMLVFKGPKLLRDINLGLIELLKKDGYTHIIQAIGANHKS